MHVKRFENGSYVLHGVRINGDMRCKYSVWCDADGRVVDCERIAANGRVSRIPARHTNVRRYLAAAGRVWWKSAGQAAYEYDVSKTPKYHTGEPRKAWNELSDVARDSWERNPTIR